MDIGKLNRKVEILTFENHRQKVLIVRHTPEKCLKNEILPE